jgi:hypothetical protein
MTTALRPGAQFAYRVSLFPLLSPSLPLQSTRETRTPKRRRLLTPPAEPTRTQQRAPRLPVPTHRRLTQWAPTPARGVPTGRPVRHRGLRAMGHCESSPNVDRETSNRCRQPRPCRPAWYPALYRSSQSFNTTRTTSSCANRPSSPATSRTTSVSATTRRFRDRRR